jgi:hypothetical protein
MIAHLKSLGRGHLVGAEIGVAVGDNAASIVRELPMKMLYLIDPYVPYFDMKEYSVVHSINLKKDFDVQIAFKMAKKRLEGCPVTFIKEASQEAAKHIPEMLDFVYIDGNHSYSFALGDLRNYWPLVKESGGVIGGHDYGRKSVEDAVNDFADENNLAYRVRLPDWWIEK